MTARVGVAALALGVAACAVSPTSDLGEFAQSTGANSFELFDRSLAPDALVLPVEHDRQTARPSCGAHVLASVVNYWRGPGALEGETVFRYSPPANLDAGYSMAELLDLTNEFGLLASAVRLSAEDLIAELEKGRPVVTPVRLPAIYVQQKALPGADLPALGVVRNALVNRTGRAAEWTSLTLVDHYLLVIGYEADTFVVIEPVMGYRTIGADTLARYREPFGNAAMVFSAASS